MPEPPSLWKSRHWQWDGPVRVWVGISFKSMVLGVSFAERHSLGIGLGPFYFGIGGYGA